MHSTGTKVEVEMGTVLSNLKSQLQEVATIFVDAEENDKVRLSKRSTAPSAET